MFFHSKDLRKGRHSQPQQVYLITTSTLHRSPAFCDFAVARILINVIKSSDEKGRTATLGFVVMPDHLHWVICLGSQVNLWRAVGLVKGASAFKINRQTGHRCFCWQDGFHDHALRRDEDLQSVMRYVLLNPVRAGLVERIGDYPHWDCVYV